MSSDFARAFDVASTFFSSMRPPRRRTWREFAEQELVLPHGPRARFSCEFMPWTALVLAEFDRARYRRYFASGPVQSGKSLLFFVLPALYHLFECGEDVILCAPTVDMARSIYEERLRPVIEASRFRDLLPVSGPGSRGGRFLSTLFRHGARLRYMGAGGRDSQRSSYTAPVVILTEIDKMDRPGIGSREADPVTQMEARTEAFGARARVYGECTMSVPTGRIYQEVVRDGTDTQIRVRCPRCGDYVACTRANFAGWQDAPDVLTARERAHFVCPSCGAPWTEADRAAALRRPVLVARGQTVSRDGTVRGDPPRTNTFGVRWNAMHNALRTMGDIGEAEWRCEHGTDPNRYRALYQFTWAEPWEEQQISLAGLSRDAVLAKVSNAPRGVVPSGAVRVTVGVDVGLWWIHWVAVAWQSDAQGLVFDYDAVAVPQGAQPDASKILPALRALRSDVLLPGWAADGGARRVPDLVLVDSGYQPDYVYTFVVESGQGRYLAAKGCGTTGDRPWRVPKDSPGREWAVVLQPGTPIKLVEWNADRWKELVHAGFLAPSGSPGSLTLYEAAPLAHQQYARQILAEHQEETAAGKRRWVALSKANHYLDATTLARVGADLLGVKAVDLPAPAPVRRLAPSVRHVGKYRRIIRYG